MHLAAKFARQKLKNGEKNHLGNDYEGYITFNDKKTAI